MIPSSDFDRRDHRDPIVAKQRQRHQIKLRGQNSYPLRSEVLTVGISQQEAEQVFLNEPLLLLEDTEHSRHEPRFHAYGHTEAGRRLQVSFTLRDEGRAIRVISTRPMSKKERERYEAEI